MYLHHSSKEIIHCIIFIGIILFFFSRYYKNKTPQRPGWDSNILKWCLKEARANNLKPDAYMGGFILDEMKVQVGNLLLVLIFMQ